MVYQSPEVRTQRITAHAETVSAQFRKALAILSVYPAHRREKLLEQVSGEYTRFYNAVELALQGRYVREVQKVLGSEARSWLTGQVPRLIARYSFIQVSDSDLAEREAAAKRQIAVCTDKRDTALEVIAMLQAFDGSDRAAEVTAVKRAFRKFKYAFNLYQRGVAWKEIADLTGEPMQSRIEAKTIPEIIVKYAGYPLTKANQAVRNEKCAALRASAQAIFERAKAKQSALNPQALEKQIEVWKRELKSFHLVVDLYQKGLEAASIKTLTKLSAHDWLRCNALPVKVTRAGLDLTRRDFTIPERIDSDFSYIAGAIFGSKRVFSRNAPLVFPSAELDKLSSLKSLFEEVFQTSLPAPRLEKTRAGSSRFVLAAGREALVTGILDMLGIPERAMDPVPPFSLIRNKELRVRFIRGYLDYAGLSLDLQRHRFGIIRGHQPNIIKALGVALYLEGICPIVRAERSGALLAVTDTKDFHRLVTLAPGLLPHGTPIATGQPDKPSVELISSYDNYRMIKNVLVAFYGSGEKLNFKDILRRSGISIAEHERVPRSVKDQIRSWARGVKPPVVRRGQSMEKIFEELYGEHLSSLR
jgi:hypothetical protein